MAKRWRWERDRKPRRPKCEMSGEVVNVDPGNRVPCPSCNRTVAVTRRGRYSHHASTGRNIRVPPLHRPRHQPMSIQLDGEEVAWLGAILRSHLLKNDLAHPDLARSIQSKLEVAP